MITTELTDAAQTALAAHDIEVASALVSLPDYPHVLTDFNMVVVKLRVTYDDAWDEIYWTRILGDGGVPVAPLLDTSVVRIRDAFGVVMQYLAPDRATDERDAAAAGIVMRRVHDLAFEYVEADGTSRTPHDSQPRNFVMHRGVLYLVDLDNEERHTRASARRGAASEFANALQADARAQAHSQFLASYDSSLRP